MKIFTKTQTSRIILAVLVIALLFQPVFVSAQALSPQQLSHISSRCASAQISLQQLQKRDAVSRINRGRAYDQLMAQISAMNSRLAFNKISISSELVPLSGELQTHIDRFRKVTDKEYLDHLVTLSKFNCRDKPLEFYQQLIVVREDRNRVVAEVAKIDELIGRYREVLAGYQAQLRLAEQEQGTNAQ